MLSWLSYENLWKENHTNFAIYKITVSKMIMLSLVQIIISNYLNRLGN